MSQRSAEPEPVYSMKSSIRSQIIPDLERAFDKVGSRTVAQQVGSLAMKRILERTERGQFLGGKLKDKPYSRSYAKYRRKKGRNVSPVTLFFTGAMLGSLQNYINEHRNGITVTLTVAPRQQMKAFYTDRQREWLGLSDNETEKIIEVIERQFRI